MDTRAAEALISLQRSGEHPVTAADTIPQEAEGLYQQANNRQTPQQDGEERGVFTGNGTGAANHWTTAQEKVSEEERRNRHTQHSSTTVALAQTEDIGQENNNSPPSLQDPATPIQTSEQQLSPSQGASSASLPSSTASKKHKSPFPTQSNTLLSYFQPRSTSISSATPRTPQQAHPHSISRTPQLGNQPSVGSVTQPEHHSSTDTTTQTEPVESTASKLTKQLHNFHRCTHQDHAEQEQAHNRHHQRDDVHSECASFESITRLLCGDYNNGTPLPDVLSNPCFKRAEGLADSIDCQGAFEGTSPIALPKDIGTRNEKLPLSLCMSKYYQSSTTACVPKTTFDIDSLCCFPSSLGFARQGIHWLPNASTVLNLSHNIHFSLKVPTYNPKGELCQTDQPLHKIPHYYFGTAIGIESVQIYIFFPELHLGSGNEHSTFLSNEDFKLWYDSVLMPAIQKSVADSNVLQHYPVSAEVARLDATVLSAKTFAKKSSSREQLLKYALQPQHLHQIWTCIQDSIAGNPLFSRFRGAALFAHSKNTKLEYMTEDLSTTFCKWQNSWSRVTDPQFCNPGYIRSLQQEGGGITFSQAVCEKAYLHMKQRAHVNLRDNLQRSYGIREEHRISLTMMEEIKSQWTQQDLYSVSEDSPSVPLPYYIVPTQELLGFLRAQINKYCFLFEHTRANTFGVVPLAAQAVMIVALRALRFCYGSNILAAESLLYKDRWEKNQQQIVVVEGFSMQQTIEQCGLGWFLPKFNWTTLRIKQPHEENMLNGCLLMHTEYKKRWQAVKDLQNVYVRFNQAERWFHQHNIGKNPALLRKWLEYLSSGKILGTCGGHPDLVSCIK
ncbi:hypothetical protein BU25DRAFT_451327, partial [Macroventuria anomochaeta]